MSLVSVVEGCDPNEIRLSENAVRKVSDLVTDEGNPALQLRVYITGGGCSGVQYGFTFDEDRAEDDWVIERDGVVAVVDAMSYQYLVGSEVDYTEGLEGARFVVNNPNAVTTCGCGASFSILKSPPSGVLTTPQTFLQYLNVYGVLAWKYCP